MSERIYARDGATGRTLLGFDTREADPVGVWGYLRQGHAAGPRTLLAGVVALDDETGETVPPGGLLGDDRDGGDNGKRAAVLLSGGLGSAALAAGHDSRLADHIVVGNGSLRPDLDKVAGVLAGRIHRLALTSGSFLRQARRLYQTLDDPAAHPALVGVAIAAERAATLGHSRLVIPLGARALFGDAEEFRADVPAPQTPSAPRPGTPEDDALEEERCFWTFGGEPPGAHPATAARLWARMRRLAPLARACRAACEIAGVQAVMPFVEWGAWWWVTRELERGPGDDAAAWLRRRCAELGIPAGRVPPARVAVPAVELMQQELAAAVELPFSPRLDAETFAAWSLRVWAERNDVDLVEALRARLPVKAPARAVTPPTTAGKSKADAKRSGASSRASIRPTGGSLSAPIIPPAPTRPPPRFALIVSSGNVSQPYLASLRTALAGHQITQAVFGADAELPGVPVRVDPSLYVMREAMRADADYIVIHSACRILPSHLLGRAAWAFERYPALAAVSALRVDDVPAAVAQAKLRLPPLQRMADERKVKVYNRMLDARARGRILQADSLREGCLVIRAAALTGADTDVAAFLARLSREGSGRLGLLLDCVIA